MSDIVATFLDMLTMVSFYVIISIELKLRIIESRRVDMSLNSKQDIISDRLFSSLVELVYLRARNTVVPLETVISDTLKSLVSTEEMSHLSKDDVDSLISKLEESHKNKLRENFFNSEEKYLLIDLERTIQHGRTYYWNNIRHGYTTNLLEAGLFFKETADEEVKKDFNKRTVTISVSEVIKIIK